MSVYGCIAVISSVAAICISIATMYFAWVLKQERRISACYDRGETNVRQHFPTSFAAWMKSWIWWSK